MSWIFGDQSLVFYNNSFGAKYPHTGQGKENSGQTKQGVLFSLLVIPSILYYGVWHLVKRDIVLL